MGVDDSRVSRLITLILCSQIISSAFCAQAWVQIGSDIYGQDGYKLRVGQEVQLSGDGTYLVTSCDSYDHESNAYAYKFNGSQWQLEKTMPPNTSISSSISSDAQTFVSGYRKRLGRIAVYRGNEPSSWGFVDSVVGSYEDLEYIYLGRQVEVSANGGIVASNSSSRGTFVYSFDGSSLNQLGSVINAERFAPNIEVDISTDTLNRSWWDREVDLALSSDGQFIVISAQVSDYSSSPAMVIPYVRMFRLGSNDWVQVGDTLSDFADGQGYHDSGTATIALNHDGTILVVGLPYIASDGNYRDPASASNEGSDRAGMVRTYTLIDGNWQQVGHDLLGSPGERLGSSLSISADGIRLAVGSQTSISTYQWTNQGWVRFGDEIDSAHTQVALSPNGQVLAIGNSNYSNDLGRVGVVRTYTYEEDTVNVNFDLENVLAFKIGGGAVNQVIARGGNALSPNFDTLFGYNFLGWSEALEAIGSDINITPILESTNVGLDSFYESDTGVPVTVSVLPDDLTSYTYQWYHNGFAIPPAYGGADSSYTIPGSVNSDGSWTVEVSYLNHTETANFEYRVFVDSDSDGYSDYRESNILGTNPNNADTDGDGLSDYDELETHGTDPTLTDSNGDGFGDGVIFNSGLSLSTDYSALSQDLLSRQKDLRIGSKISSVANNVATLQVLLEESEDLESWTERQTIDLSVPMQDGETTKFFRYKMAD